MHGAACGSAASETIETCANDARVQKPITVTYAIGRWNSGEDASQDAPSAAQDADTPSASQDADTGGYGSSLCCKRRKADADDTGADGTLQITLGGTNVSSWGCKRGTVEGAGHTSDLPVLVLEPDHPREAFPQDNETWLSLIDVIPALKDERITEYSRKPSPGDYFAPCRRNDYSLRGNVFFSIALDEVLDFLDPSRARDEVAITCATENGNEKWVGRYARTHALDFGPGPCCGRHFAQHFTTLACLENILKDGLQGTRSLARGSQEVTNEAVVWCSRSDAMIHRATWTLLNSTPWFVQCTVVTEVGGPYSNMQNLAVVAPLVGGMNVRAVKLVFQPHPKLPRDTIVTTVDKPRTYDGQ